MNELTYLILALVLATLGFSVTSNRNLITSSVAPQKQPDHKRTNERFPTADYDIQDSSDPEKNAKRKRYNDGKLVYARVDPSTVETQEYFLQRH